MSNMLTDKEKYPYQFPIPDCHHNIKSVRSAEFWYWIDLNGYLVNVRLLWLLRSENEEMKKSVSLKALRNKDRMDVETAVAIHIENVRNAIPDKRISTTLVPELEFRHWKKNGSNLLSYPVGVGFSTKHSKVFVTDRLRHSVYMVDLHCFDNATLVAGGVVPGYLNGSGRKARFSNPAGVVENEGMLYVCDQGNGRVRVVNVRSLFCHASQISQEKEEDTENDNKECAVRRIHKVDVQDLSLSCEKIVPDLEAPFALSASTKEELQLFVPDLRLNKIFSISKIWQDEENKLFGSLKEVIAFERCSVLTALSLTRDERYILVGDSNENNPCVYVCEAEEGVKIRAISNIPSPMGIAITEEEIVFVSSSKGHAIYCLN